MLINIQLSRFSSLTVRPLQLEYSKKKGKKKKERRGGEGGGRGRKREGGMYLDRVFLLLLAFWGVLSLKGSVLRGGERRGRSVKFESWAP